MNDKITVLDQGYVLLIESWGSDERIIEAARMSTDQGFKWWGPVRCPGPNCMPIEMPGDLYNPCEHKPKCDNGWLSGDEKLLRYLWEHKHATPFEMGGMSIEVQAPIFVFREWHRHRTQSYNEMSARYTPLPDLSYVPTVERLMLNAGTTNRQAGTVKGSEVLTRESAEIFQDTLESCYATLQTLYEANLAAGVPKELARLVIPVGRYSRMRASANLRNWLGFLTLRMAPDAQWEIRQYANEVAKLVLENFPRTYALFAEGS